MSNSNNAAAIIVAAGQSKRAGVDKITTPLGAHSVLTWSIKAFMACPEFSEVIVVTSKERYEAMPLRYEYSERLKRVDGGEERQDSVAAGLAAVSKDIEWVAVHDGARPLITPGAIQQCLAEAKQHKAAALARHVTDTVRRTNKEGQTTSEKIPRHHLWLLETPQCFERKLLDHAYDNLKDKNKGRHVNDEASAVELVDQQTKLVEHHLPNLKITLPEDLEVASFLMSYIRLKQE